MKRYLIDKDRFDPPKELVKKISFMFIQDGKICDGCDEIRKCASIKAFDGVMIICEECVTGILSHFNPSLASLIREDAINRIVEK